MLHFKPQLPDPGRFDESDLVNDNGYIRRCGPVAQLGARFHGMEEVIGSIPIRSTNNLHNSNKIARLDFWSEAA